ncbi:DUF4352 domain-containing protein [Dactylosporangium sp. NPDC000244]|uniref:DUF4352 domain-containing protein n=1 Tax=Dactylosporangium sp. NPDC000244 TaxID=3154365 RepID=UPI003328CEE8
MTYPDPRQPAPGPIQRPQPPGFYPPTSGFPATGPLTPPPFPPPPRKKGLSAGAIVGIVIGGVIALCCLGGIALVATSDDKKPDKQAADNQPLAAAPDGSSSGGSSQAPAAKAKTTAAAPAKTPDVAGAGSAVRDGKFEFAVTKGPDCGKTQIAGQKAQGRFCQITLQVKNIGNDARTFDDSNVVAYDAAGARYETDGVAGLYANPNGESFLEKINPGNQVSVVVVFDVAANVKLVTLELHDSLFSRGAKVALP